MSKKSKTWPPTLRTVLRKTTFNILNSCIEVLDLVLQGLEEDPDLGALGLHVHDYPDPLNLTSKPDQKRIVLILYCVFGLFRINVVFLKIIKLNAELFSRIS